MMRHYRLLFLFTLLFAKNGFALVPSSPERPIVIAQLRPAWPSQGKIHARSARIGKVAKHMGLFRKPLDRSGRRARAALALGLLAAGLAAIGFYYELVFLLGLWLVASALCVVLGFRVILSKVSVRQLMEALIGMLVGGFTFIIAYLVYLGSAD